MSDAVGTATVQAPELRPIPAGWRVIGSREFTEHLLSVRFIALPGPSDDEVTEVLAHALRSGAFGASTRVELAPPGPPN